MKAVAIVACLQCVVLAVILSPLASAEEPASANVTVKTADASYSCWKIVGAFLLGLFWLTVCSLLGGAWGNNSCLGLILGLVFGAVFLFGSNDGILSWHKAHQTAFWVGFGLSIILSIVITVSAKKNG
ncbi:MAG: hypothetical protein NTX87_02590 [Planctomycetota bacterium]|nr:hypothetical protein [Planctomycetota bacterium]